MDLIISFFLKYFIAPPFLIIYFMIYKDYFEYNNLQL